MKLKITLLFLLLLTFSAFAQDGGGISIGNGLEDLNLEFKRDFQIGGVVIEGADHYDKNVLMNIAGLIPGEEITVPGDKISDAIDKLWKQGLFADVKVAATRIEGTSIFLKIYLEERPRCSHIFIKGVRKGEADDLLEKVKRVKGSVVTDNVLVTTKNQVLEHLVDKGFLDAQVEIKQVDDSITRTKTDVNLEILIKKGKKVKINDIVFIGNQNIKSGKLRRAFKDTKTKRWYHVFNSSKYIEENFTKEKQNVLDIYNSKGYRDAKILWDTVYRYDDHSLNIEVKIDEGHQYYFRNISWLGNARYSTKRLNETLAIKRGDIFNQAVLDQRLNMSQDGRDISSMYMDSGYLFFQVNPVEILVENDSIDLEIRIYEGKQAIINKVTITGNTKTNDYVVMREIRTKPGMYFSRQDIIRTQRELAQLRYFDAQKLGVNPVPNPADGTVDIEYTVEETPSDQVQLSAGWGQQRLVGTLGLTFNNFSTKNILKKGAWTPLPSGDGQTLNIQAQSTGLYYQGYNISFVEPWLGGKKPNSLSVSAYYSVQNPYGLKRDNPNLQLMQITGVSVGLGQRLKRPDDWFILYQSLTYERYQLKNYASVFSFSDGFANNLAYEFNLTRNSIDAPIYPMGGSQFKFSFKTTAPYSLIKDKLNNTKTDYAKLEEQARFKWVEYHKWKFTAQTYTRIVDKLVLNTKAGFGFLGFYNRSIGQAPFERFVLGGSGLTGFVLGGREIIALRGYADGSLKSQQTGDPFINKFTMELRYPISLNPQATIFVLGFAEAGKSWSKVRDVNPFNMYKSAGVGIRVFLPMFGMLGLDYGFNFDKGPQNSILLKGTPHFTIGANIGDL